MKIKIKSVLLGLSIAIVLVVLGFLFYNKFFNEKLKTADKENYGCEVDSDCGIYPAGNSCQDDCMKKVSLSDQKFVERLDSTRGSMDANCSPAKEICMCKKNICQKKGVLGFFSF